MWMVSGVAMLLSLILSVHLIYKHLRNYNCPILQRYIIRILIMVPVYSIDSWLSLLFVEYSLYFDFTRDIYEAYVLYSFFCLIVAYVEMHNDVFELLEKKQSMLHPWPLSYCLPRIKLGPTFLRNCQQMVLQFVFVKPVVAIVSIVLQVFGYYGQGKFVPDRGYLWLVIIENISVWMSLYALVLFYQCMSKELQPFKPFGKFMCIKMVIFFSFWQGVIIALLSYFHVINSVGDWTIHNISEALQNFIICLEMFVISVIHHYFFPYAEYKDVSRFKQGWLFNEEFDTKEQAPSKQVNILKNFMKAANVSDVIGDTKQSFLVPLLNDDSEEDDEETIDNIREMDSIYIRQDEADEDSS
ncbi:hypothetical protein SAMD00019534_010250, partial [Acytostelium subglobosum LB1]|uniref:hypothetical protein n=1 Tax=Acytostelium subglobosum LB1 TaxID=1410327 RepID=UPI0006450F4F